MGDGDIGFVLRRATVEDADALAVLATRTFVETYAAGNDPADLAAYVAANFRADDLVGHLQDPTRRCMVADSGGALVGYVSVHSGSRPDPVTHPSAIELSRLYVESAWQGRGLGSALLGAAIGEALALGGKALWLGVWERNERAIAFYSRHGFEQVGVHTFTVGEDVQLDHLMVRTRLGRGGVQEAVGAEDGERARPLVGRQRAGGGRAGVGGP